MNRRSIILVAVCALFLVLALGSAAMAYAPDEGVAPTAWSIEKLGGKAPAYRLHLEWDVTKGEPGSYIVLRYDAGGQRLESYGPYTISPRARTLGELTTRAIRANLEERFDIELFSVTGTKYYMIDYLGPDMLWTY